MSHEVEVIAIVVGAASATVCGIGGMITERIRSRLRGPAPELTCVGYVEGNKTVADCNAVRSHLCSDGRCSFHCGRMCMCDLEGIAQRVQAVEAITAKK